MPEELAARIRALAESYPWWGYKRIALVARHEGLPTNIYRVFMAFGLLQKKRVREAALYQAARLFELLPQAANDLWQANVAHLRIPGHGWWYAVTVIDYYPRYPLTCHFTSSYTARDIALPLDFARTDVERIRAAREEPVSRHRQRPGLPRQALPRSYRRAFCPRAHRLSPSNSSRVGVPTSA